MSSLVGLVFLYLFTFSYGKPVQPDADNEEVPLMPTRTTVADQKNPVLEYILRSPTSKTTLQPGARREITHFQTFPSERQKIIAADSAGIRHTFHRDPEKSPAENFKGYILAGRRPEENLVMSPVLNIRESTKNQSFTKVDVFPAVATVVQTYDESGRLRGTVTRYEPAGKRVESSSSSSTEGLRQQITWPYAGYFPILIKDPFLSAFNSFATGTPFTWSSLVEYGPEADICRREVVPNEDSEVPSRLSPTWQREKESEGAEGRPDGRSYQGETGRRRRENIRKVRSSQLVIADPVKGQTSVRVDDSMMNGNIQADDLQERVNRPHLVIPPFSSIVMPHYYGYDDKKRKPSKPSKPDKEESNEEENVGEENEESTDDQESSDGVAVSPPPEGASVAEAKPVGLAIAGPGGVASAKPSGTAVVGPGGLAIARPVGTAIAGVDVEGSIPIGQQQQQLKKPQKKKPKQVEYETDPDSELQYVGGLAGPIGSPRPKHTPPETNYIGGLRGVVGNPIPKYETPHATARQSPPFVQFRLGMNNGKYGFLPFVPEQQSQARTLGARMDEQPVFFHGMIGANGHKTPVMYY